MTLVALTHRSVEQRLYAAMLQAALNGDSKEPLTARRLKVLTGIRSLSTIRRGLEGLLTKSSIVRVKKLNGNGAREAGVAYRANQPEDIIVSRREQGLPDLETRAVNLSLDRAIKRVFEQKQLSRREVQVVLCCVEGMTNAEIGSRLQVTEQTVKFHLRNVFIKLDVKRRAELISKLLR